MAQRRSAAVPRRAPRLGPDERIARHMTRAGRFAKIDPQESKPVPSAAKILGVLGWMALTVESIRRARARAGDTQRTAP